MTCEHCNGAGWTWETFPRKSFLAEVEQPMHDGKLFQTKCDECDGEGRTRLPKRLYVEGRNCFSLSGILMPNVSRRDREILDEISSTETSATFDQAPSQP